MRSNGLPSGHTDLDRSHPGLGENMLERVKAVEVLSAPLGPEIVEQETAKNVQRLSNIGEASHMVREESGQVVLLLDDGFPQKHERPGGDDVIERLPFSPNSFVGFPSALRHGAFEQAMDGRFNLAGVVDFALGRDAHEQASLNSEIARMYDSDVFSGTYCL